MPSYILQPKFGAQNEQHSDEGESKVVNADLIRIGSLSSNLIVKLPNQ